MTEPLHDPSLGGGARWITIGLLAVAVAGLAAAMLALPEQAVGLSQLVAEASPKRDLANPVTLVLLDLRGYDTLLELGVLLLAIIAVRALSATRQATQRSTDPMLAGFVGTTGPVMALIAGYLLWAGADDPGGAFQAGAILGALGVVLLLTGRRLPERLCGWSLRLTLILGLTVFVMVAAAMVALGGNLLEYPHSQAKTLIIGIETAATLSIGATLAALFLNCPSAPDTSTDNEQQP